MNYRRKANVVLGTVFGIFLIAAFFRYLRPESTSVYFFYFVSEAALVGGIADWFAVTAIFRKPLGWPYHTALIPRNRDKMITGIIAMVQDELLSESLIRRKLENFKVTTKMIGYVERSGGGAFLTETLRKKLRQFLTHKEASIELENKIKKKLLDKGSAKQIIALLNQLLEKEAFHNWLNKRVEEGVELASGAIVRGRILQTLEAYQEEQRSGAGKLHKTLMGFLQASDTLNLEEAADAIQIEMILHTRELLDQNHPLREQLIEVLTEKLRQLEEEPVALNIIEQWKNTLVAKVNIIEFVLSVIDEDRTDNVDQFVEDWWSDFKGDTRLQVLIDQTFQDLIIKILQSEHIVIGQIVRDTLEGLSDEELNQFIEDKAGNDLQWIRINGSLVGGVVGAIMFVILNYGYTPLLEMFR